jgi:hypothetical protein
MRKQSLEQQAYASRQAGEAQGDPEHAEQDCDRQADEPMAMGPEEQRRSDEGPEREAVPNEARAGERARIAGRRVRRDMERVGGAHRLPFVDGTRSASRASLVAAARTARATPLKQLSAMWWLLAP